jgi:hypothetical protein
MRKTSHAPDQEPGGLPLLAVPSDQDPSVEEMTCVCVCARACTRGHVCRESPVLGQNLGEQAWSSLWIMGKSREARSHRQGGSSPYSRTEIERVSQELRRHEAGTQIRRESITLTHSAHLAPLSVRSPGHQPLHKDGLLEWPLLTDITPTVTSTFGICHCSSIHACLNLRPHAWF